jgi:soluble P-type ATPase
VIQKEGASARALMNADIVCNSIVDALELLTNPLRIVATLRK